MNIDLIKWMVRYAEGYHLKTIHGLDAIDYGEEVESLEDFSSCESIARSHLLTRVIEGINKKGTDLGFYIEQLSEQVVVERTSEPYKLFEHMPIDQAKEEALKYIYEQETK